MLLYIRRIILTGYLFFSSESQYLARSSGDFDELLACLVTELLLINLPHAC